MFYVRYYLSWQKGQTTKELKLKKNDEWMRGVMKSDTAPDEEYHASFQCDERGDIID